MVNYGRSEIKNQKAEGKSENREEQVERQESNCRNLAHSVFHFFI